MLRLHINVGCGQNISRAAARAAGTVTYARNVSRNLPRNATLRRGDASPQTQQTAAGKPPLNVGTRRWPTPPGDSGEGRCRQGMARAWASLLPARLPPSESVCLYTLAGDYSITSLTPGGKEAQGISRRTTLCAHFHSLGCRTHTRASLILPAFRRHLSALTLLQENRVHAFILQAL